MTPARKFLCVCEGGNVRSHALAFLLHDKHGQEAICCGWRRASKETLDYFCAWADYVVVMQAEFVERISAPFREKVRVFDVGPDRFGIHIHAELLEMVTSVTSEWAGRDFRL